MADSRAFTDHIRDMLVIQPWFAPAGLTHKQIYKRYPSQVKDGPLPAVILAFDPELTEVTTDIAHGKLLVDVYVRDYTAIFDLAKNVQSSLHTYLTSTATTTIYQCHHQGGYPEPTHDTLLNAWTISLEFIVKFV